MISLSGIPEQLKQYHVSQSQQTQRPPGSFWPTKLQPGQTVSSLSADALASPLVRMVFERGCVLSHNSGNYPKYIYIIPHV